VATQTIVKAQSSALSPQSFPGGLAVATIIAKNYTARARVLAQSLERHHPGLSFFTHVLDEPPRGRTITEVATAAKPAVLRQLLDQGFTSAVFLDPDILVRGSLDALFAIVAQHAIVLTPHLTAPPEGEERVERELNILQSGTFNAGFVGVTESPSAHRFLAWWQERVTEHCTHAVAEGVYYDQRWLDLAPVFFDDVCIVRDPAYNVAYWNLPERSLETARFVHFSGFDPKRPDVVSRYTNRLAASPMFAEYAALLATAGERSDHADEAGALNAPIPQPVSKSAISEPASACDPARYPAGDAAGHPSHPVGDPPSDPARHPKCHPERSEGPVRAGGTPPYRPPTPSSEATLAMTTELREPIAALQSQTTNLAACTIVAKPQLSQARVLAESFHRFHPDVPFFVLLADEVDGYFDPAREPFQLVPLDALAIPEPRNVRFHYTQQELTYAATPYLISYLLGRGYGRVAFFKQESLVTGDLSAALTLIGPHSIVLTPHLLDPLTGADRFARERNILQSGVYNVGFLGVAATPTSRAFLAWWQDRLVRHCLRDVPRGLHFEQRWLDLVPSYFADCTYVRDPAFNIGHWNLPERDVTPSFFRLSGFDPDTPDAITRYSPRLTLASLGPTSAFFRDYAARLKAAGWDETRTWPYAFDAYADGTAIPDAARTAYRELGPQQREQLGDPFAARKWFTRHARRSRGIRNLAARVLRVWRAHRERGIVAASVALIRASLGWIAR
jgi:hypothetical protein